MPETIKDRDELASEPIVVPEWTPPPMLKLKYIGEHGHLSYGRCTPKKDGVFEAPEPDAKALLARYPKHVALAPAEAEVTERPHDPKPQEDDSDEE